MGPSGVKRIFFIRVPGRLSTWGNRRRRDALGPGFRRSGGGGGGGEPFSLRDPSESDSDAHDHDAMTHDGRRRGYAGSRRGRVGTRARVPG